MVGTGQKSGRTPNSNITPSFRPDEATSTPVTPGYALGECDTRGSRCISGRGVQPGESWGPIGPGHSTRGRIHSIQAGLE